MFEKNLNFIQIDRVTHDLETLWNRQEFSWWSAHKNTWRVAFCHFWGIIMNLINIKFWKKYKHIHIFNTFSNILEKYWNELTIYMSINFNFDTINLKNMHSDVGIGVLFRSTIRHLPLKSLLLQVFLVKYWKELT